MADETVDEPLRPVPRDERTPGGEAKELLQTMADLFTLWFPDWTTAMFRERYVAPLLAEPSLEPDATAELLSRQQENSSTTWNLAFTLALHHAVKAIREDGLGATQRAWTHIYDAARYFHTLRGAESIKLVDVLSDVATRANDARYALDRANKAKVFDWMDKHYDARVKWRSLNAIRDDLATLFNLPPGKVRTWLTKWAALHPERCKTPPKRK